MGLGQAWFIQNGACGRGVERRGGGAVFDVMTVFWHAGCSVCMCLVCVLNV